LEIPASIGDLCPSCGGGSKITLSQLSRASRLGLVATLLLDFEQMATVQEFRCEICGLVTSNPIHWFVIQCGDSVLAVHRWDAEAANTEGARHYCGEAHAQVYISRWFESVCTPPKPTYK
jgi:hypothetical protein